MAQRKIQVTFTGNLPLDGYKAALERIRLFEKDLSEGREVPTVDSQKMAADGTTPAPDPALPIVVTSLSQYEVYVFNIVDLNPVTGVYNLELVSIGL